MALVSRDALMSFRKRAGRGTQTMKCERRLGFAVLINGPEAALNQLPDCLAFSIEPMDEAKFRSSLRFFFSEVHQFLSAYTQLRQLKR